LTTEFTKLHGSFSKEVKILRDPQTSRVTSTVDEVANNKPAIVTTLQYRNATDQVINVRQGYPIRLPWAPECEQDLPAGMTVSRGMETLREYEFKPGGFPASEHGGDGIGSQLVTDGFGRIIQTIGADGSQVWQGYDEQGKIAWKANYGVDVPPSYGFPTEPWHSLQAMVEYQYDKLGRMVRKDQWKFLPGAISVFPTKVSVVVDYDDANHSMKLTDEAGRTTIMRFDGVSRLISRTLADGSQEKVQWLQTNQALWTLPAPSGQGFVTRRVSYDGLGMVTRDEYDAGGPLMVDEVHDVHGRTERRSVRGAAEVRLHYDSFGRLIAYSQNVDRNDVNPGLLALTNRYRWDRSDQLIEFTDGGDHHTTREFDGQERLIAYEDALGRKTSYEYVKGSGRVAMIKRSDGSIIANSYSAGQLQLQQIHNGQGTQFPNRAFTRAFTYDPIGRIKSATIDGDFPFPTKGVVVNRVYDSLGELSQEFGSFSPLPVRRESDPQHAQAITYWGTNEIHEGFESLDRESTISLNGQILVKFGYAPGRAGANSIDYANGVHTRLNYDDLGQPVSQQIAAQERIASLRVGFGRNGVPRYRQSAFRMQPPSIDLAMTDNSGRLLAEAFLPVTPAVPLPPTPSNQDVQALLLQAPAARRYQLDGAGNWRKRNNEVFMADWANCYVSIGPDPVTISPAGAIVGYSSHGSNEQYLFDGLGQIALA
jgi:YD repeat-containing protein